MENKNEDINSDNKTDIKVEIKEEIKEEPRWSPETSPNPYFESEEPVSESEMENNIKMEATDVPELPIERRIIAGAAKVAELKRSIARLGSKRKWNNIDHDSMVKLLVKQHEMKMECLKMDIELVKMQIHHQKIMNELHLQEKLKLEQEQDELKSESSKRNLK